MHGLETALGVTFADRELLRLALVHRSYVYEHPDEAPESNERLEYLGDAVLGYASAIYLYRAFPHLQEGQLTALRAAAVRADTLAKFAKQIDLDRHLLLGHGESKSGGAHRPALLSGAFEAVIGALALDRGIEATVPVLERFLIPEIQDIVAEHRHENFKSRLQEHTQATQQVTPEYRTVHMSGPPHNRTFTVEVVVGEEVVGEGQGASKRLAQQAAAREALEKLAR